MLDLSPTKILVILVVAVVLLGPKRLPQVARQLGAGWRRVRDFAHQLDHDVRQSIPDLPSSQDIARFARSPMALLDQLAQMPTRADALVGDPGAPGAGRTDGTAAAASPDGKEPLADGGAAWPEDAGASAGAPSGAVPGPLTGAPGRTGQAAGAPNTLGAPWGGMDGLAGDDPGMN